MRKDHRPYALKKAHQHFERWYTRRWLKPHFASFGRGASVLRPWFVEVFGGPVRLGDYATLIATPDRRIRLSVWSNEPGKGEICIGSYCLISPGVRIGASACITIGDNCMIASGAYITDCDWHGIYDRVAPGESRPVTIADNVWIGDGAIVCKGVSIGENSIVGAGAVVTRSIEPNVIAAGNPAQIVRRLDPDHPMRTRGDWFREHPDLGRELEIWDRCVMQQNSFRGWLRALLFPMRGD